MHMHKGKAKLQCSDKFIVVFVVPNNRFVRLSNKKLYFHLELRNWPNNFIVFNFGQVNNLFRLAFGLQHNAISQV